MAKWYHKRLFEISPKAGLIILLVLIVAFVVSVIFTKDWRLWEKKRKPTPVQITAELPKMASPSPAQLEAFKQDMIKNWNAYSSDMGGSIVDIELPVESNITMFVKVAGYDYQQCRIIAMGIFGEYRKRFGVNRYVHIFRGNNKVLVYRGE